MNSQSALQLLNTIDQTISDIDSVSGSNVLTDSYLAKFLVVYICGIYEETIETIFVDFVRRNTPRAEIIEYARKTIDRSFRNPNSDKLIELAGTLGNSTWTAALKTLSAERIALDSIVTNKNDIAHGRGSTITLGDVKDFYRLSRPLIEKFDEMLL